MFHFPINSLSVTTRFILYAPFGKATPHYGMDFGCAKGTPVYAANSGKVVLSGWDSAGGNMVAISGEQELSRYAHLNSRAVSVGQSVNRGDLIGYSGNTGSATTGPHLHFETWITPRGYVYKYADRERYAVDPMCVCHLLEGQTFDNNGLTTCNPIPYPEPKAGSLSKIDGTLTVKDGSVRLRLIPEASKYQYIVGGYNRCNDTLADFFSSTSFTATHRCVNDGYTWALISTDLGAFWVALLAGKTELTVKDEPTPPTPQPQPQPDDEDYKKKVDELEKKNAELQALYDQTSAALAEKTKEAEGLAAENKQLEENIGVAVEVLTREV